MNKRILLIVLSVIGLIILTSVVYYISTTKLVKVTYDELRNVTVYDESSKQVASIAHSGDTARLSNSQTYTIKYEGSDRYAAGSVEIGVDDTEVTITPDYSLTYYDQLKEDNRPKALKIITDKYPNVTKYKVSKELMIDRAEWYFMVLEYKGEYTTNSDDLRVIFKKSGDSWDMVTKPDIILDVYDNPDVPRDILLRANQL
jgi:hypothetical protein